MNSNDHFQAGELTAAVEACTAELKKEPTNVNRRLFFCELLCFQGDWQRADKQLETVTQQDSAHELRATVFRQLIRGELARQEAFTSGRVPTFLADPTPALTLHLRALVARREGDERAAAALVADAEAARCQVSGDCDGVRFDDLRDVDDLTASFLEVITAGGEYVWLPWETIASAEFRAPRRPRDLLWRPAHVELHGAPSVDGFIPALYAGTSRCGDDQLRLGRATQWTGADDGPVVGVGLRMLLFGERDTSILELTKICIDSHG